MSDSANTNPSVPSPPPKNSRLKRKTVVWFMLISLSLIGVLNLAINNATLRNWALDQLRSRFAIKIEIEDFYVNLFWGSLTGKNLNLHLPRQNVDLELKDFDLQVSPAMLIFGKIQIIAVNAQSIYLDLSKLTAPDPNKPKTQIPSFLKNIRLKHADIKKFALNQGDKGLLYVEKVRLTSKFGSLISKSPTLLEVRDLKFLGKSIHVFAKRISQEGFFIFDFSSPRLIDESRVSTNLVAKNLLLSFRKKPKPWLTNPAWDEQLTPTLNTFYANDIPKNRSYLFVSTLGVSIEKSVTAAQLNQLYIKLGDGELKANGQWNRQSQNLNLKIQTHKNLPLSLFPLGQANLRTAFSSLKLNGEMRGQLKSIDEHDIKISLQLTGVGNQVNPPAGDLPIALKAQFKNKILNIDSALAQWNGGEILAKGKLDLSKQSITSNLTAQNADAQTIVRLFSSTNIPSLVNAQGTFSGDLKNPTLDLKLTSPDAGYEFLHFGPARATLLLKNKNFKLDVDTTTNELGNSKLGMTISNVFDGFEQVLKLNSTHQNVPVDKLLKATRLKGIIQGKFELSRIKTLNRGRGDFHIKDFHFFDFLVGEMQTQVTLNHKHLELKPFTIDFAEPKNRVSSNQGVTFDFDDSGYVFKAHILPELPISGRFLKSSREWVELEFNAKNFPLKLLTPVFEFDVKDSTLTGKFDLRYRIANPIESQMKGQVSQFTLKTPEGQIQLTRPAGFDFADKAFQFRNTEFTEGQGRVHLNGALGLVQNSNLAIKGKIDFAVLADFNPVFTDSDRPLDVNLTFKGDYKNPDFFGKVHFAGESVSFRNLAASLDDLQGDVVFEGKRLTFPDFKLLFDDGPVNLKGHLVRDLGKISSADLKIKAREVPWHVKTGFDVIADADLHLRGSGSGLSLAGNVQLMEAQYTQEFGLNQFAVKAEEPLLTEESEDGFLPKDLGLKIKIKNSGDFILQNNIVTLELDANLDLIGTLADPNLDGEVKFLSGEINAFGVAFDEASGFAEFSPKHPLNPEISLVAKKEIQQYEVRARIQGRLENMRLRLDSTPNLDRRDIMAILFYGQTPDQLVGERRQQFTQTAAISQLASVLSKPINKLSGLDVVEVSSRQMNSNQTQQRLSVGKSFSKRLNLLFTTDIGIDDPERAFELQYQFFDNIYFIAAKDIGDRDRYRFDLNLRLESY